MGTRLQRCVGAMLVAVLAISLWLPYAASPAAAAPALVRWAYYVPWDPTSLTSLRRNVGQLDIVSPYFYELRADGTIHDMSNPEALRVMREAGVKIVPMIKNQSRWQDFHTTIETPEKRDAIINRLVALVEANNYDGIHIDFEAIEPTDAPLVTDFQARLAAQLRPRGRLVTQAVIARTSDTPTRWGGAYDYRALGQHNDLVVVMAYDFSPIGGPPGPIGPIGWVRSVVNYTKSRMPADRIILGMPLYGYDWNRTQGGNARALRYDQTTALLARPGISSGFDEASQTPWIRYTDDNGDAREVWYENVDSLRAKLDVMLDSGVRGFGFWRLGQEDPRVWDEVARLATPATRIPPFPDGPDRRYFAATGHSLAYGFKSFWERSGGLPMFGYPLTEEFDELNPDTLRVHTVQYFERQRFEYHPLLRGTPYEVQLGRLGVTHAAARGLLDSIPFQSLPAGTPVGPGCQFFAETGHLVCGRFREYWRSHGLEFGDPGISFRESLALFGYPISEEYTDPDTGLRVQYFERARFEYHPQHAGTPHDVLLGLLGADAIRAKGWIR